MGRRLFAMLALLITLAMAVPPASADNGKGKGKGKEKKNPHAAQVVDDHDWERRGGYEYRTYQKGERPPGWSQGKKTGWGDCDLPPGQAKKYGCRAYTYQGRTHYWYQDEHGRIIVRRPVIDVQVRP